MDEIIEVQVNCASQDEAERIAEAVVDERLAACANIHGPIRSLYHWGGRVERAEEVPLVLKTRAALFEPLAARIAALHSYEVPGILALPVGTVNAAYRDWLLTETRAPGKPEREAE